VLGARGVVDSMFNTIVVPNSPEVNWSHCGSAPSSAFAVFANASSHHPDGINALFCDGAVKLIKSTVEPHWWRSLGTVSSGEILSSCSY
jgi:prepilin-type processing-associated H-X9-DG protein